MTVLGKIIQERDTNSHACNVHTFVKSFPFMVLTDVFLLESITNNSATEKEDY